MGQFMDPKETAAVERKVQPAFKNYNKRVDIISGQINDPNVKMSGYEAFTEGAQSRTSGDISYMP